VPTGGPPSERTRVRRLPDHASYDRQVIDAVLDAARVAHVGVVDDDGQPFVLPVAFARAGDEVLVHGSVASRLLRAGAGGAKVCLTVTLLDGLIVARSLFESSMRYRSVVVLGTPREVDDPDEKSAALVALADHLLPGRALEVRPSHEVELRQTRVFALPLDEASAKVGDGWPDDPEADVASDAWAGVVPVEARFGAPLPAPDLRGGIAVPPSVEGLSGSPAG
jgi:nitroimidazol reductase NimA-like FMN-containing flavoprotein (pyridoxamine 5'-phosphate oxidase superfamily)